MRLLALLCIGILLLGLAGCTQQQKETANQENNISAAAPALSENLTPQQAQSNSTKENASRPEQADITPPAQPAANATPPIQPAADTTQPATEKQFAMQNISQQTNGSTVNNTSAELEGIGFANYVLVVEDLTLATGQNKESCAMMAIYSENGTKLAELAGCPGKNVYWIAPDGHKWRIAVYQTVAGYSGGAAWAEIAVFG